MNPHIGLGEDNSICFEEEAIINRSERPTRSRIATGLPRREEGGRSLRKLPWNEKSRMMIELKPVLRVLGCDSESKGSNANSFVSKLIQPPHAS